MWTGIGAVGTAIMGIILFGESASLVRVGSLVLIVCGILGLKFSS
ncbi:MAG: SMR family transporter [Aeromonas sp.]